MPLLRASLLRDGPTSQSEKGQDSVAKLLERFLEDYVDKGTDGRWTGRG
jgi:hypothetical protein